MRIRLIDLVLFPTVQICGNNIYFFDCGYKIRNYSHAHQVLPACQARFCVLMLCDSYSPHHRPQGNVLFLYPFCRWEVEVLRFQVPHGVTESGFRAWNSTSVGFPGNESWIWIKMISVLGGRPVAITNCSTCLCKLILFGAGKHIRHLFPVFQVETRSIICEVLGETIILGFVWCRINPGSDTTLFSSWQTLGLMLRVKTWGLSPQGLKENALLLSISSVHRWPVCMTSW